MRKKESQNQGVLFYCTFYDLRVIRNRGIINIEQN